MNKADDLLMVRRVVVEPASREVLLARLDERKRDLKFREERGRGKAIATGWLREEIEVLERALADGVRVGINGLTEAETSATASVMGNVPPGVASVDPAQPHVSELERDAARYRWLRARPGLSVFTGKRIRFRPFDSAHEIEVGQIGTTDLDEAIDAQIAHGVKTCGGTDA